MHKTIKKCCRDCVVAFLVISLFISPVTISAEQDSIAGEQRMSRTARQRLRTRITYSCTEKPIETVLMELAEQAQVDIIKSPKVTGNVTVKVTDVPLEEALTNILAAHDYTYIATESMIRVVPLPEIAVLRESLVTRIYQITYANANEVAAALAGFVSERGKIALNRGTSHIIVTDTESKIKGIDKFIKQIDHMTPQVLVEVRIYDITSNEGFELGAEWAVGLNAPEIITEHENISSTRSGYDFDQLLPHLGDILPRSTTTTTTTGDVTTTTTGGQRQTIFDEDRTDTTGYGESTSGNTIYSEDRTDNSTYGESTSGNTIYSEDRTDNSTYGESTSGNTTFIENRVDDSTYGKTTSGNTTFSENRIDSTIGSELTTGNYRDADDGFGNFTTTGTSTTTRDEDSTTTNSQTTSGWATDSRAEDSETTNSQTTGGWATDSRAEDSETTNSQTTGGWAQEVRDEDSETTNSQTTGGWATETRDEDSTTTDLGFEDTEKVETKDIIETVTSGPDFDYEEFKDSTFNKSTTTERYIARRRKPFVGASFDRATGGSLRFSLLNDMVDIDLALSILHRQVEAKLLANPRVLVLDNETANFEIIREVPYRELRQVAREDPITYTEFKNIGVQLKVTPHIARDGMIRLQIAPEFGVLVGLNAQGIPTVDTRRANTIALIKDGQTIVMGGLRKRQTTKDISKVPVLGDMPVIGGLFKSETESVQINELVIFITTRIVTEPVLSGIERKQFEATEFASPGMTKMRLERNNQLKPTVDKFKVEELTELIDQLLRK